MKRTVFLLLLSLSPIIASATGQASDIIYIDGQQWRLMGRAVYCLDSARYSKLTALLPDYRSLPSSNWDGYLVYWSLDGDLLVLDSVVYDVYENKVWRQESLPLEAMREVFGDYYRNGRIVASFVTWDKMRVAQGQQIYYEHDAWNRYYETEMILKVEQGRVLERTLYHNRVVVDGFYFEDGNFEKFDSFKAGFAPVLRKYHELDSVNKVFFTIRYWSFDSLGNMTAVEVAAICRGHENIMPQLALEFKQYLMSIHPWKVLYINGEYLPIGRAWSIPFSRKDWQ
jgi:hypothetical protein